MSHTAATSASLTGALRLRMPDRQQWTVGLGTWPHGGEEIVILVPPETSLDQGFQEAAHALSFGTNKVRVIGRGVTLRERWPSWVDGATSLCLTELDAYLPTDRTPLVSELAVPMRRWLGDVFEGAITGVKSEESLWSSAMLRLFHGALSAWPLVVGLAHHHATDQVLCCDPAWMGAEGLAHLTRQGGGRFAYATTRIPSATFGLRLASWASVCAAAACFVRAREYWAERGSRRKLRHLRHRDASTPEVWIGLLGDWPRVTRHVLEGVGQAARLHGKSVGVLLQCSLRPGLRSEVSMHAHTGSAIFPALDETAIEGLVSAVDQCASVETVGALLSNMVLSIGRSARATWRLVRLGAVFRLGRMHVDLSLHIPALARLLTFDVLRGNEAGQATRDLLKRRNLRDATIVWPHASLVVESVPDLLLQAAGCRTIDLVHGSLYDTTELVTHDRTFSAVKVLWTEGEAEAYAPYIGHQRAVGGYMPRIRPVIRRRARLVTSGDRIRILALTNYINGSPKDHDRVFRLECYQHAFFAALSVGLSACPSGAEIHWRPHPSDSRPRVDATAKRHDALRMHLSFGRDGLREQLDWADIVLTSMSSVIVEALDYPVPILVHDIPLLDGSGVLSFIAPERRFSSGEELGRRLGALLRALFEQSPHVLAPEVALEERFFGPRRERKSLDRLLWSTARS